MRNTHRKINVWVVLILIFVLMMASVPLPLYADEAQNDQLNTSADLPTFTVEKLVWNGTDWAETVEVDEGDIVEFSVSIYNPSDVYELHWSGVIFDQFPCNLRYINESTTLPLENHPDPGCESEEIDWQNNSVLWHVERDEYVSPHQYLNFTYQCRAVCCPEESGYLQNMVTVSPDQFNHICNASDIIYNDGSMDVSDSASVKVNCLFQPAISIEKQVNTSCGWMNAHTVNVGNIVEFRLIINNTGTMNLTAVEVIDTLPSFLIYNNDATLAPASFSDHEIQWVIADLLINESVQIRFTATATATGQADNVATVTSCQGVTDSDTAHIIVAGMIVEKKVWDPVSCLWIDEIDASVGDTIRFRITVSYTGNGAYNLYNIKIRDDLPECLIYADNAVPEQSAISSDGKTIWWNLSIHLQNGEQTFVEFDAFISETSGCGPCINLANVTANECSGGIFSEEDTATVNAECPLVADASGPYSGDVCENILIQGSASGGQSPYQYQWDLDDDGAFDDQYAQSFYFQWNEPGYYPIHLMVIDDDGRNDIDSTTVMITSEENNEPDNPGQPTGPSTGEIGVSYTFTTSATDEDDDNIKYGWDWNADSIIDEWTGFFSSGQMISRSHSYDVSGTFQIQVIAMDEHGAQSGFSPLKSIQINGNVPPNKPLVPNGPMEGKPGMFYSFSSKATDADGDHLFYQFDWGDGTKSEWIGPYESGSTVTATHIWNTKGSYSIKIKARDDPDGDADPSDGRDSVWSDALPFSLSKSKTSGFENISTLLFWLTQRFPILKFFIY